MDEHVTEVEESGFRVECNGGAEVEAVEGESNGVGGGREVARGWKWKVLMVGVVAFGLPGIGWGGVYHW